MSTYIRAVVAAKAIVEKYGNGKHLYVVPDGYCHLAELKEGVDNG